MVPPWPCICVQMLQNNLAVEQYAGYIAAPANVVKGPINEVVVLVTSSLPSQVVYSRVQRSSIIALVREAITHALIRAQGSFYHQRQGIPQVRSACSPVQNGSYC